VIGPWRLLALAFAALTLSAAAETRESEAPPPPDREILVMLQQPDGPREDDSRGYGDGFARNKRDRLGQLIADRHGLALVDAWPMALIGYDCFVMEVPAGRSTADVVGELSKDRDVAWSQPVQTYSGEAASASPNDPLFAAEPAAKLWHLADLHRIATGRGVKIAVIDSGIDNRHPDLAGQVALRLNFVPRGRDAIEQHGTSVAGIIAAKSNNRIGIAGVAPGSRILALRACWQEAAGIASTVCDSFSLAKALYFAISTRADVINLSLSGPDDRLLRELLKVAVNRDLTVVTAFDARRPDGGFPANAPGVIAVSDTRRGHAYIAPGRDVPTTEPGGRWFLVNGSSFAAAHVSGLVALMRQRQRSNPLTLVTDRDGPIDACATLIRAAGNCVCSCGSIASRAGR
jgi:subtilisin family serine protease